VTRETRAPVSIAGIVLLLAVLGAHAVSLGGDFVWDDLPLVRDNASLLGWHGLPDVFTRGVSGFRDGGPPGGKEDYWRPLTFLTFFADARFWGRNPVGYHLTNVLLHAAVALLLFRTLRDLGAGSGAALAGAGAHALNPAVTESVDWISGRTDVLAALLVLLAARAHFRGRSVALVAVYYGLAVFAKETALVFPAALLGLDAAFGPRTPLVRRLAAIAPLAIVPAVYLVLRLAILGIELPGSDAPSEPLAALLGAIRLVGHYAAKALFPVGLNAEWEPDLSGAFGLSDALVAAAAAGLVAALSSRRRLAAPVLALACVFGVFLAPVLGLAPLPEVAAERFLYLPLLGVPFLALLSWPRGALPAAAALVCLLGVATARRAPVWGSEIRLFEDSASKSTENDRAIYNLATGHFRLAVGAQAAGDLDLAQRHFDEAMAAYERVDALRSVHAEGALIGISQIERARGQLDRSYETLKLGVERFPGSYLVHLQKGKAELALGMRDAAVESLRRAVEIRSDFAEPFRLLGGLYRDPSRRDLATAQEFLEKAIELEPRDREACQMLASVLAERAGGTDLEALDRALDLFRRALALDPTDVTSMQGIATILVYPETTDGRRDAARIESAIPILVEAIRLEGRPELYWILADASAKLGRFDEARHWIRVVIEDGRPPDVERWRKRLVQIDEMERAWRPR